MAMPTIPAPTPMPACAPVVRLGDATDAEDGVEPLGGLCDVLTKPDVEFCVKDTLCGEDVCRATSNGNDAGVNASNSASILKHANVAKIFYPIELT